MRKSLFLPAAFWCVLTAALFSACPDAGSVFGSGPKLAESVTLSETAISLAIGETRQLFAAVEPQDAENKALFWASAASGFATVSDSGLVTAIAEGGTVVTATTRDGSNRLAICTVTVTPPPVKVTSIAVSPSSTSSLERGSTLQLSAAVLPADAANKTVTWSSGNQAVATVNSNGLVSGIAASATPVTITATANDGSGVYGTATVTVTLPAGYTEVTSITATPVSLPSPFYPGNTFTINTGVLPANATDMGVSWSVSPAGIVTLSSNTGSSITVTAAAAGTATITAAATGGVDKTATVQVTVTPPPSGGPTLTITSSFSGTVYPGNKIPVSVVISPEGTSAYLSWSSSNQSVATVALAGGYNYNNLNAVITAVGQGTAIITASDQYDSELSGTYTVTVSPVPVSSLSLDKTSRELSPGGTFGLTATVAPDNATNKAVSWSVQPAGIVTLSATTGSSITITAAGTGSATITASSGGKTATCAVSVKSGSGIGIDFAGFDDETIDLTPNYLNDLSRKNYDTLTVSVSGSYVSISWHTDGSTGWTIGNPYTIYANNHAVGVHYLTAVVETNDTPPKYFSKELSFRVVE
ncbi:MAG: Ig-like domain-containing protein [Treponema sp.]|jgi:uncharacterized protein YjdB|nr:Ig-like domain-containing protein [Treponema sp.]